MGMPYKNREDRISISVGRDLHKYIYDQQKPHETIDETLRRLLKR